MRVRDAWHAPAKIGETPPGDGDALWFAEITANAIGRISLDGTVEEFPLPDPAAKPHAIVATAPGDCWFTRWGGNRMGRITARVAGERPEITGYDLASPSSEPHGLTVGPFAAARLELP